jgi:DNA-directed RNA polymerase specialized sigma24 family protein
MEEWSYQDIANALGCNEGTVKSRINRARQRLRDELAPYWTEGLAHE